jgi:CheY-like chemotaxis protein
MKSTILVVDDTAESLALLARTLASEGYDVRPADSGELALASAMREPPDLILLDIRMPGINGYEVCRRLKAEEATCDIPIIFLSASTDVEERVQGLSLGAVDYISKPYHREELLVRVRNHLELSRLRFNLERLVSERTVEVSEANEQLRKNHEFQRNFLHDVLACVTDGVLVLCHDSSGLPQLAASFGDPVVLADSSTLLELRSQTRKAAAMAGLNNQRTADLVTAADEAGMNSIVHVGAGLARIAVDEDAGKVQVWVEDSGSGITLERLPKATLLKGYTTAGTLGFGMKMMLSMVDHVSLLTGASGTTVVLEQSRVSPATDELNSSILNMIRSADGH